MQHLGMLAVIIGRASRSDPVGLDGTSRQVQAVFIAQLVAFIGFCLSKRDPQPVTVMGTV